MREPELRRERRERVAQTLALVGTALTLAAALYAAWISRSPQREGRPPTVQTPAPVPTRAATPPRWQASLRFLLPWTSAGEPTLDPARHTGDPRLLGALFLGLTTQRPGDGEVVPVLADAWEVSEQGRVYTFRLRGDVFWVRCEPTTGEVQPVRLVTAGDIAFAVERALQPETGAPDASLLYPIVGAEERHRGEGRARLGVEVLDPFTVRFQLRAPTDDFPLRLAAPVAWPVPREVVEQQGGKWTEPGRIWTNGAYCLLALRLGRGPELVRNPFLPFDLASAGADRSSQASLPGAVPLWLVSLGDGLAFLDPSGRVGVPSLDQVRFLGLWHPGSDGSPVPVLVESWQKSEDDLQHTIRIHQGIYWVRCDAVTLAVERVREVSAEDVIAGLILALRRGGAGEVGRLLPAPLEGVGPRGEPVWMLPGVQAEGRYTLSLTLREPAHNLDEALALPFLWPVPKELLAPHSRLQLDWSDGPYCALPEGPRSTLRVIPNPWLKGSGLLQGLAQVWDIRLLPFPYDIPDQMSP